MPTDSPYTAFQDDAFQRNAFQIFTNVGYADVSISEIVSRYASVSAGEPNLTLARVSVVEISS